jgi:hypothetical protein
MVGGSSWVHGIKDSTYLTPLAGTLFCVLAGRGQLISLVGTKKAGSKRAGLKDQSLNSY